MNKVFRWCPDCGKKQVECFVNPRCAKEPYRCKVCYQTYTKAFLDAFWKKEQVRY